MIQESSFSENKKKIKLYIGNWHFFLRSKAFLFWWWPSVFENSSIFWKSQKLCLSWQSFKGCMGDIHSSAISIRSLMVLSKLNSTALSITIQILFHLCWKIFIDTWQFIWGHRPFKQVSCLKILLPCYIARLKIINLLQHYLMTLPNQQ